MDGNFGGLDFCFLVLSMGDVKACLLEWCNIFDFVIKRLILQSVYEKTTLRKMIKIYYIL